MSPTQTIKKTRQGFTLVEMLVAVALVLLMMSMFAAIFQQAAGAVSTQRGLAENDQRARSVFSLIRADLQKRSPHSVQPFVQNESPGTSPYGFGTRRGYFYISTNDGDDSTDDMFQFTTNALVTQELPDTTPTFGHATQLLAGPLTDLNGDGNIDQFDLQISLVNNPNQPEADDEEVYSNGTASSGLTEISYFLRGGNLYRRVMLVRQPLRLAGEELGAQPVGSNGTDLFDTDGDKTTYDYAAVNLNGTLVGWGAGQSQPVQSFWGNFDYSAFRTFDSASSEWSAARFAGVDGFSNEPSGATFFSLGKPQFRFGFDSQTGLSREHTDLADPKFIGRFTLGETADIRFGYPQGPSFGGIENPLSLAAASYTLSEELKTVQFGGTDLAGTSNERRSEDLLLTNVQEFRVEIWDERLGNFTAPGYSGTPGDFEIRRRRNGDAGPFGTAELPLGSTPVRRNNVFDSWHPGMGVDAPYRPLALYPPGMGLEPTVPVSGGGTRRADEATWWQPDTAYGTEDTNGNGFLDPGEDANNNGVLDADVVFPLTQDLNGDGLLDDATEDQAHSGFGSPFSDDNNIINSHVPWQGLAYHYVCVRSGSSGPIADPGNPATQRQPRWQARPGAIITEDGNGDGTPGGRNLTNGEPPVFWRAVPNVRPLRSIRITIRFIDPSTDQSRQVTIIQSLLD